MPAKLTHHEDLIPSITTMILYSNPEGIINALKGMADRPDFTEILPSISVPTVIIAGENDTIVAKERVEMMARLIRKNWVVNIPNSAHMSMMEAPELVAKSLVDLIQTN